MEIHGTNIHVSYSEKVSYKPYDAENGFFSVSIDARIDNLTATQRAETVNALFLEAKNAVTAAIKNKTPGIVGTPTPAAAQHIQSEVNKPKATPASPTNPQATTPPKAPGDKAKAETPTRASTFGNNRTYTFPDPNKLASEYPGQVRNWTKLCKEYSKLMEEKRGIKGAMLENAVGIDIDFRMLRCVDASDTLNVAYAIIANLKKETAFTNVMPAASSSISTPPLTPNKQGRKSPIVKFKDSSAQYGKFQSLQALLVKEMGNDAATSFINAEAKKLNKGVEIEPGELTSYPGSKLISAIEAKLVKVRGNKTAEAMLDDQPGF